jgi:two-component system, sensor histidine kinase RegB
VPTLRATPLAHRVSLRWLVGLRWAFIAGAALAVPVAQHALHLALPVVPIVALIAAAAATNLACTLWLRRRPVVRGSALSGVLLLDGVLVGAVLWLSGGIENPFVLSYLVLVVLASALLGRRAALGALAGSVVAVALLSANARPLVLDHEHEMGDHHGEHRVAYDPGAHLRVHAEGSWAALAVVALLVIYLVDWVLRRREAEVAALVAAKERGEKLAELGALAAQAAHELGTPLSTIAVVSRELELATERGETATTLDDLRTIRAEVERCREVLAQIARRGRGEGEAPASFSLGELVAEARALAPDPGNVEISIEEPDLPLYGPRTAIVQTVRGLLANAQEAAGQAALSARRDGDSCRIEVTDRGPGMSPELQRRAGEVVLPSAQGMGMGLFLSRAILERVGGRIELAPDATGTTARLFLPLAPEGS